MKKGGYSYLKGWGCYGYALTLAVRGGGVGGGEESVHSFQRHSPTRRVNTAGSHVAGVIELSLSVSDCVRFNLPFLSQTASSIAAKSYLQANMLWLLSS